jgi:hypothetical protein
MHRTVSRCPVCDELMYITQLCCPECHTSVQGVFGRCRFCNLGDEHREFLDLFLRSRGNLTSVGDDLGISFPTVAKRLDGLLDALGLRGPSEASPPPRHLGRDQDRKRILELLDRGEITAEEAARRLQEL